jgi:ABC-2 type transport system ATP-binding protein
MMDKVICTENLFKYYGKVKAVDGISISIHKGEIYGFLGLNGAGKTTTIRMLLGMIRPTSGASYLNGRLVTGGNPDLWKNVGNLVEIPYSYPDLTVSENLDIIRRLRFIENKSAVDEIIARLGLDSYHNVIARNLSLGNAQRLGLAKALIHNPDILLLDEPANGLDPAGIVEIREMLQDLAINKGVTVFISSHILGEISKFATRIGIIHEGRLILESGVQDMEKLRKKCLQVRSPDIFGAKTLLENKGYNSTQPEGGFLEIHNPEAIQNPENIAAILVNSGFPPNMLKVEEEDLESFFLRVISMKGGVQ